VTRAKCPVCGRAAMTCGDAVLALPPVDFSAPHRPASPEAAATRDARMVRIASRRAERHKAMGAPSKNKAIQSPPEDK